MSPHAATLIAAALLFLLAVSALASRPSVVEAQTGLGVDLGSHSYDSTLTVGETTSLIVRARNTGGSAAHGGVAVSFQNVTTGGSHQDIVNPFSASTNFSSRDRFEVGSALGDCNGPSKASQPPCFAQHLTWEGTDHPWTAGVQRDLRFQITPPSVGQFVVFVRAWVCNSNYSSCAYDSNGHTTDDQQGFDAQRLVINVAAPQPTHAPNFFPTSPVVQKSDWLDLRWVAVLHASTYRVYEYGTVDAPSGTLIHNSPTTRFYHPSNVQGTYWYRVQGCNGDGACGPLSHPVQVTRTSTRVVRVFATDPDDPNWGPRTGFALGETVRIVAEVENPGHVIHALGSMELRSVSPGTHWDSHEQSPSRDHSLTLDDLIERFYWDYLIPSDTDAFGLYEVSVGIRDQDDPGAGTTDDFEAREYASSAQVPGSVGWWVPDVFQVLEVPRTAPQNLRSTGTVSGVPGMAPDGNFSLAWDPIPEASHYLVYRSHTPNFSDATQVGHVETEAWTPGSEQRRNGAAWYWVEPWGNGVKGLRSQVQVTNTRAAVDLSQLSVVNAEDGSDLLIPGDTARIRVWVSNAGDQIDAVGSLEIRNASDVVVWDSHDGGGAGDATADIGSSGGWLEWSWQVPEDTSSFGAYDLFIGVRDRSDPATDTSDDWSSAPFATSAIGGSEWQWVDGAFSVQEDSLTTGIGPAFGEPWQGAFPGILESEVDFGWFDLDVTDEDVISDSRRTADPATGEVTLHLGAHSTAAVGIPNASVVSGVTGFTQEVVFAQAGRHEFVVDQQISAAFGASGATLFGCNHRRTTFSPLLYVAPTDTPAPRPLIGLELAQARGSRAGHCEAASTLVEAGISEAATLLTQHFVTPAFVPRADTPFAVGLFGKLVALYTAARELTDVVDDLQSDFADSSFVGQRTFVVDIPEPGSYTVAVGLFGRAEAASVAFSGHTCAAVSVGSGTTNVGTECSRLQGSISSGHSRIEGISIRRVSEGTPESPSSDLPTPPPVPPLPPSLPLPSPIPTGSAWTLTFPSAGQLAGASSEVGIAGYSYEFAPGEPAFPDATTDSVVDNGSTVLVSRSGLTAGEWWFAVRAIDADGRAGPASISGPFIVDATAPLPPTLSTLDSGPVAPGERILVTWPERGSPGGATDGEGGSGVVGLRWSVTASPSDPGDGLVLDGATTSISFTPPGAGEWYFNLAPVDAAGNVGPTTTLGPLLVLASCTNATLTASPETSGPVGSELTLTASADGCAEGERDYEFLIWSPGGGDSPVVLSRQGSPELVLDTTAMTLGQYSFGVRVYPEAGQVVHLGSAVEYLGAWWLMPPDTTAPTAPLISSSTHTVGQPSSDNLIVLTWPAPGEPGGAFDLGGVEGYSISDTEPPSDPGTPEVLAPTSLTSLNGPPDLGDGTWWFNLRVRDKSGNWSDPTSAGPFIIDTTAPSAPTVTIDGPSTVGVGGSVHLDWPEREAEGGTSDGGGSGVVVGLRWSVTEAPGDPDGSMTLDGATSHLWVTPPSAGTWFFNLAPVDAAGNVGATTSVGPITVTPACTNATLEATPAGLAVAGSILTLAASAAGCPEAGREYEFSMLTPDGGDSWVTLARQSGPTLQLDTSALAEGQYSFLVRVYPAAGQTSLVGTSTDVVPSWWLRAVSCSTASLTTQPGISAVRGGTLRISASATGCPEGGRDYEFYGWTPSSGEWEVLGRQSEPLLELSTAGWGLGEYSFAVRVYPVAGQTSHAGTRFAIVDSWWLRDVTCSNAAVTVTTGTAAVAGSTITLSASADGCPDSGRDYEFLMWAPDGDTWTALARQPSPTIDLDTTSWVEGQYSFAVRVYPTLGQPEHLGTSVGFLPAWWLRSVSCTNASVAASPAPSAAVGSIFSLTAAADGCPEGDRDYEFLMWAPGTDGWVTLSRQATPVLDLDTTSWAEGQYSLAVRVYPLAGQTSFAGTSTGYIRAWWLRDVACSNVAVAASAPALVAGSVLRLTATADECLEDERDYEFLMWEPGTDGWVSLSRQSTPALDLDTTGWTDGQYSFAVRVYPIAGQTSFAGTGTGYLPAWWLRDVACDNAAVAAPSPSGVVGSVLRLTAGATGCPEGEREYEFLMWAPGTDGWVTLIRQPSSVVDLDTSDWAEGQYSFAVRVYPMAGQSSFAGTSTGYLPAWWLRNLACSNATLTPSEPAAIAGTLLTLTADADGCPEAGRDHEFLMWSPESGGWMSLGRVASASIDLDTTGWTAGQYSFAARLYPIAGEASFAGTATAFIPAWWITGAACTDASLTTSEPASIAGSILTLTASAAGCPEAGRDYEFLMWSPDSGGWMSLGRVASPTVDLDTTGWTEGQYSFAVRVFPVAGEASFAGTAAAYVPAWWLRTTGCSGASLAADPSIAGIGGSPVTLTATAEGCAGGEYEFLLWSPDSGGWLTLGRQASPVFEADTAGWVPGQYSFAVRVFPLVGQVSFAGVATAYLPAWWLQAVGCSEATLSASSPALPVGASLQLTAGVVGCPEGGYEFLMWSPSSGGWTVLASHDTPVLDLDTTGWEPGQYSFAVRVYPTPGASSLAGTAIAFIPAWWAIE